MGLGRRLRRIGRRIRRGIRRVGRFAGGIVKSAFKGDIGGIIGQFAKPLSKILDKLPFGNVIKAFAGKFLSNPMALLSIATLGPVGAMAAMATNPMQIASMVSSFAGTPAGQHPQGRSNLSNVAAARMARMYFGY